ncbi:MAG: methyl-accepting chemotaxis protein [bacterium]|nr:methyl-accepting chemotaxis protein [bacterium]
MTVNILRTIKAKMFLVLILFSIVVFSTYLYTYLVVTNQKSDSLVVNVAGRQRMLSQKVTKECLIYSSSIHSGKTKAEAIQNTVTLFEKSLNALLDGGETFSDLGMTKPVTLPPATTTAIKEQLKQVKSLWLPFKEKITSLITSKGDAGKLTETLITSNIPILKAMHKTVGMMQADSEKRVTLLLIIQAIGGVLFIGTGLFFLLILRGNLLKPVDKMLPLLKRVATGDLTVKIETAGEDEISQVGRYINRIIDSFLEIIHNVKKATGLVVNSSEEITAGSEELSERTNEEAASITEASTTLEQLTAFITKTLDNSRETGSSLHAFNEEIRGRSKLMEDVTATMDEINEAGKKINDIVNVINEISFQTNLLALNAAVEAARAGEAGRGFAVVASEVRNLAQKTATSSRTIQSIVSENLESTQRGLELVQQTAQFIATITRTMKDSGEKIEKMSDDSKAQVTSVQQINVAVQQLDDVINQNASMAEELFATTQNMTSNSQELRDMVNRFKVSENEKQGIGTNEYS